MTVAGDDGVLRCAVSSPRRGGSLDLDALASATARLRGGRREPVRYLLLVSSGANFCTGGDERRFHEAADVASEIATMAESFHDFIRAVMSQDAPVVAAVRGWAAGAGLSLVCLADVVVAASDARLRAAYGSVGLSCDGGLSWLLPRIVGLGRARELLVTDRAITAEEASALGLVHRLVGPERVDDEAAALAAELATGPPSPGLMRRLLLDSFGRDLFGQLDAEVAQISAAAASPAGREGVAAFAEGRAAVFARVEEPCGR